MPRPPRRQRQLPVSPDERLPKAVGRLLFDQTKAGRLIANAFADKTAPDPERVCLWEPESKIGPSCLRAIRSFSINPYMLHYPFGWYHVVIRSRELRQPIMIFLVVSFMLPSDGHLDDR